VTLPLFIDELHIAPEYRGRRVGQRVIERVIKEAKDPDLPVKLTVLKVNPAKELLFENALQSE
jgi:GNAT superfamily N-acetyltransferase